MIGKTTVDLRTTSESKGQSGSYSNSGQVVGRELITLDEVGLLGGNECILSIRGLRPFRSRKYIIEEHEMYKWLSDYNKKYTYFIGDSNSRKINTFYSKIASLPRNFDVNSLINAKVEDFIDMDELENSIDKFINEKVIGVSDDDEDTNDTENESV